MRIIKKFLTFILCLLIFISSNNFSVFAETINNTKDQNDKILQELKEFWGDDKTAQEAFDLLKKHNLIDENGNLKTDWSKEIKIIKEKQTVPFSEIETLDNQTVYSVNNRASTGEIIKQYYNQLNKFGLITNNVWVIKIDDAEVSMNDLYNQYNEGIALKINDVEINESIHETLMFLKTYDLLEPNGIKNNWNISKGTKTEATNLSALLMMLKDPSADRAMIIDVGGTQVTLGDFEVMMQIEDELKRIQGEYFSDEVPWSNEHALALQSLQNQIAQDGSIMLSNYNQAQELVFPSGIDHSQRILIAENTSFTLESALQNIDYEISLAHPAKEVVTIDVSNFNYSGKSRLDSQIKTVTFNPGERSKIIKFSYSDSESIINKNSQAFAIKFSNPVNALINDDKSAFTALITLKFTDSLIDGLDLTKPIPYNFVNQLTGLDGYISKDEYNNLNHDYTVSHVDNFFTNSLFFPHITNEKNSFYYESNESNQANPTNQIDLKYGFKYNKSYHSMYWEPQKERMFSCDFYTKVNETLNPRETTSKQRVSDLNYTYKTKSQYSNYGNVSTINKINFNLNFKLNNLADLVNAGVIDTLYCEKGLAYTIAKSSDENPPVGTFKINGQDIYTLTNAPSHLKEEEIINKYAKSFSFKLNPGFLTDPKYVNEFNVEGDYTDYNLLPHSTDYSRTFKTKLINVSLMDTTKPTVISLFSRYLFDTDSETLQNYRYGHFIPVMLSFSEPVYGDNLSIVVNGKTVRCSDLTDKEFSKYKMFLYPLTDDTTTELEITNISGARDLSGKVMDPVTDPKTQIYYKAPKIKFNNIHRDFYDSFSSPVCEQVYNPVYDPETKTTKVSGQVTMDIETNEDLRTLIVQSYVTNDNLIANKVIAASFDGGQTLEPVTFNDNVSPTKLVVNFSSDISELTSTKVMELYKITVDANNNITSKTPIFGKYAAFSISAPTPLLGSEIQLSTSSNWPTAPIFTSDDIGNLKLTATLANGTRTWNQYEFVSSNPEVATVDQFGNISIIKAGTVSFYAQATNGGNELYRTDDKYRTSHTSEIIIKEGFAPYLKAAQNEVTVTQGDPLTVIWRSNLAFKNAEINEDTTFKIELLKDDVVISTTDVTFNHKDKDLENWPNQKYSISGFDEAKGNYKIRISSKLSDNYEHPQREYSAELKVNVAYPSVKGNLVKPKNIFTTNAQNTYEVPYKVQNFNEDCSFKLVVTNNKTGEEVLNETTTNSEMKYSFNLNTQDFRTIYDVYFEVSDPTTTKRDSYTLYVYDKDSLDVIAESNSNTKVDGNTITLSNRERIKNLSSQDILNLKRDINLKSILSINYGDHKWGEVLDRIEWNVDNTNAAIYFKQFGQYQDIKNLEYSNYAPATKFILSGEMNGSAKLKAQHAFVGEGLSVTKDVIIETLKDKLYIFQCIPAVKSTVKYTNGDGKEVTLETDGKGQVATYEENGINSNVEFFSSYDSNVYLGTIYKERLKTEESSFSTLELYPLNTIRMRKIAQVPVILQNEDGTAFNGKVNVRFGVYRNDVYCEDAKLNSQNKGKNTDYVVNVSNGKIDFTFDTTKFDYLSQGDLNENDKLKFIFEIDPQATNKSPIFVSIDSSLNAEDMIKTGDNIYLVKTLNNATLKNVPIVVDQIATYSNSMMKYSKQVLNYKGELGPGIDFPELKLSTTILCDPNVNLYRSEFYLNDKLVPYQNSFSKPYPFAKYNIYINEVTLNKTSFDYLNFLEYAKAPLVLKHTLPNGQLIHNDPMPWKALNALSVTSVMDQKTQEMFYHQISNSTSNGAQGLNMGDSFIAGGLSLLTNLKLNVGILNMKLVPTSNPLVFKGLIYAGIDAIQNDNVSGFQADVDLKSDGDPAPGISDLYKAATNFRDYAAKTDAALDKEKDLMKQQHKKNSPGGFNKYSTNKYTLCGNMETSIFFNTDTKKWEMVLLNTNVSVGFGMEFFQNYNIQAGPLPLTMQLGYGASGVVTFNAAINNQTNMNDYLTQLRINAYVSVFAGVGIDYSLFALKIGAFGQINGDVQLEWLNAAYAQQALFAYKMSAKGSLGFKASFKFLFMSYEHIFVSASTDIPPLISENYDKVHKYWDTVKSGKLTNGMSGSLTSYTYQPIAEGIGLQMAELPPVLEPRDYLLDSEPAPMLSFLFSMFSPRARGMEKTIDGSYPNANPVYNDDGKLLFYLDDMNNATDASVLRVAVLDEGNKTVIDDSGFGDMSISASGSHDNATIAFVRFTNRLETNEPGSTITLADQTRMMNGSEIFVGRKVNGSWSVEKITDNFHADLAPTVVTKDDKIYVAWRESAVNNQDYLSGNKSVDNLVYKYFDGASWSEKKIIHNGDNGSLKGHNIAIMDNGKAAVAFAVDISEDSSIDQDVYYAVLNKDEIVRYVRANSDSKYDENPQIASVTYENTPYFVIAWHTLNESLNSDVNIVTIDENGDRITLIPENLSTTIGIDSVKIDSKFRFNKNAKTIEDLSILWKEIETLPDSIDTTNIVSGIRFTTENALKFSARQEIARMDADTVIDDFDAYVDTNGNVQLTILGTYYDKSKTEDHFLTDGATIENVKTLASRTSIYKTSGSFIEDFSILSVTPDYAVIAKNSNLPIMIAIKNEGTKNLTDIYCNVDGIKYNLGESLEAGEVGRYTINHPIGEIKDPAVEVHATAGTENLSKEQICNISFNDVGIVQNNPLISDDDGKRSLVFNLYNLSDFKLKGTDRIVKFGLYIDDKGKEPIGNYSVDIDGDDLEKLDNNNFNVHFDFDILQYAKDNGLLDDNGEIKDNGFTIFAIARIEEGGLEIVEFNHSDNVMPIKFESLIKTKNEPVSFNTTLTKTDDSSTVTTQIKNNSLNNIQKGNIVVTLRDENDQVVSWKQFKQNGAEYLTLTPENSRTVSLDFPNTEKALTAVAEFIESNELLNDSSLSTLTFHNTTLLDFTLNNEGVYEANSILEDYKSMTLGLTTSSDESTVIVSTDTEMFSMTDSSVDIDCSKAQDITITVTSKIDTKKHTLFM